VVTCRVTSKAYNEVMCVPLGSVSYAIYGPESRRLRSSGRWIYSVYLPQRLDIVSCPIHATKKKKTSKQSV